MSAGAAQIAVLGAADRRAAPPDLRSDVAETPLVQLAAFAALGLYGTLRWSTLLATGAQGRLLALLVLALALVAVRAPLAKRSRVPAALATTIALLAALAVSGVPLAWIVHARVAVTATAIGEGLSALPQVLVPYGGVNEWVRIVIILGAAVLLFDAALLLTFAPRTRSDLRRAGAALPLVALAAVPATLVHPTFPYVDGLVIFALLAAFMWGDRIPRQLVPAALTVCAVAAVAAMVLAPTLDRHKAWINYRALAGGLAPQAIDTFSWSQSYGPITWPRHDRTVLEVKAAQPDYWKAENLDVFDGRAWSLGQVPGTQNTPPPARGSLKAWSQTIEVTVRDMQTSNVIGAGVSAQPTKIAQTALAGLSPGTFITTSNLAPGDSYLVKVYAPNPSPSQLNAAGQSYSDLTAGYRAIGLPPAAIEGAAPTGAPMTALFAPFHSSHPVQIVLGAPLGDGAAVVQASPYARAYRLAQRLTRGASTPYAFAVAVESFLSHGYIYSESPPVRQYPLESFLFQDKRGYCQQFAGAMALLLRMGGVPARVAVGFTTGREDTATHRWLVSDSDAHAWVEAWFPHYGWVKFDPTPAADPALGGRSQISLGAGGAASASAVHAPKRPQGGATAAVKSAKRRSSPSRAGSALSALDGAIAVVVVALLALVLLATRPLDSPGALVTELERAFARTRRPLTGGATLAGLERRMTGSEEAGGYVRTLRLQRFGGAPARPSSSQRRALRRHLAAGLGPAGRLRALWALPPRRGSSRIRPRRPWDA